MNRGQRTRVAKGPPSWLVPWPEALHPIPEELHGRDFLETERGWMAWRRAIITRRLEVHELVTSLLGGDDLIADLICDMARPILYREETDSDIEPYRWPWTGLSQPGGPLA